VFERYSEFLKFYIIVIRVYADYKINKRLYDNNRITNEVNTANEIKLAFEKGIYDEINQFVQSYSHEYLDILEKYKLLINSINTSECNILKSYTKFIKINAK
jgi:hypothetical protein